MYEHEYFSFYNLAERQMSCHVSLYDFTFSLMFFPKIINLLYFTCMILLQHEFLCILTVWIFRLNVF